MVSFCKMRECLILLAVAALAGAADLPPSCEKPVYCNSDLLHEVQMARIFNDSKTFVDLQMKFNESKTLGDFQILMNDTNQNPSRAQLEQFVTDYFSNEGELEDWKPSDHSDNPAFLATIKDEELREFGKGINDIWPLLARKIKAEVLEKPDQYSLVPLTHGFIIPGGRFKEIYYWDSFWIIEGLLISGMQETAKGMIENLIELLVKFGHIPNGSRWYYQERSQPPMLTAMVAIYYQYTQDLEFVRNNIGYLETEMAFWQNERAVTVEKDGVNHTLFRYYSVSDGPRPESYFEDYNNTIGFSDEERTDFYIDTKSAAESGWDFSTRWFLVPGGSNNGTITDIHTRYIIPVDLNAILAGAFQQIAVFNAVLLNLSKSYEFAALASDLRNSIEAVLWNKEDSMWYDYNTRDNLHRKYFYSSNVAPLWQNAVSSTFLMANGPKIVSSLEQSGGLDFPGGVPTSLIRSGEQWDFPNVWPPEVSIVVNALANIGTDEAKTLSLEVAQTFVRSCHWGFLQYKQMFEKYDAENPGQFGGGGEYNVQFGFGWSNGAILEFLHKYGSELTASDNNVNGTTAAPSNSSDPPNNSA
uniref:Trehalase n=1 Tax=Mythimna separata TaxID=271217 RepID=A0A7L8YXZ4_MYTSE|nr:trehalase-1 [Mythimna separata]